MLSVEEITTTAALQHISGEWESLWARVPMATPFQSPHWCIPWWKHVAEGDLWTLAVREISGGPLLGLLPLYRYRQRSGSRDLFPLGIATSDYLDLLLEPRREAEIFTAAATHLQGQATAWDMLDLQQLRDESPTRQLTLPTGWTQSTGDGEPCPVLDLHDLDQRLGENVRQNLRYYRRRAQREGAVIESATAQNAEELFAALLALHAARWRERHEPGVLAAESVQRAHGESLPLLLNAGLLRLYGLRVAGKWVAVFYGFADARRVYYYLGGFDPAYQALSPGTLLIGHAVDAAAAEGKITFDFLRGREPYKYLWGAADSPTFTRRFQHGRPS